MSLVKPIAGMLEKGRDHEQVSNNGGLGGEAREGVMARLRLLGKKKKKKLV